MAATAQQVTPEVAGQTIYVSFTAEVNPTTTETLLRACTDLTNKKAAASDKVLAVAMSSCAFVPTLRADVRFVAAGRTARLVCISARPFTITLRSDPPRTRLHSGP